MAAIQVIVSIISVIIPINVYSTTVDGPCPSFEPISVPKDLKGLQGHYFCSAKDVKPEEEKQTCQTTEMKDLNGLKFTLHDEFYDPETGELTITSDVYATSNDKLSYWDIDVPAMDMKTNFYIINYFENGEDDQHLLVSQCTNNEYGGHEEGGAIYSRISDKVDENRLKEIFEESQKLLKQVGLKSTKLTMFNLDPCLKLSNFKKSFNL